jgi:hypothetical protein
MFAMAVHKQSDTDMGSGGKSVALCDVDWVGDGVAKGQIKAW